MSFSAAMKKEAGLAQSAAKLLGKATGAAERAPGTLKKLVTPSSATRTAYQAAKTPGLGQGLAKARAAKELESEAAKKVTTMNKNLASQGKPAMSQEEAQTVTSRHAEKYMPSKMKEHLPAAQAEAVKRAPGIAAAVKKGKPSFASKHPYLTAGLAAGATHMAFGGGEEKKDQGPPVVYGQSY